MYLYIYSSIKCRTLKECDFASIQSCNDENIDGYFILLNSGWGCIYNSGQSCQCIRSLLKCQILLDNFTLMSVSYCFLVPREALKSLSHHTVACTLSFPFLSFPFLSFPFLSFLPFLYVKRTYFKILKWLLTIFQDDAFDNFDPQQYLLLCLAIKT